MVSLVFHMEVLRTAYSAAREYLDARNLANRSFAGMPLLQSPEFGESLHIMRAMGPPQREIKTKVEYNVVFPQPMQAGNECWDGA